MDATAQAKALRSILAEARHLAADGDPLLQGLYQALVARLEMLLCVLDTELQGDS